MRPALPSEGYVRLYQIIGDRRTSPPTPPVIPVGKSTWWAGTHTGRFPAPDYPFGPRIPCWRVEKIRALIERRVREECDKGRVVLEPVQGSKSGVRKKSRD